MRGSSAGADLRSPDPATNATSPPHVAHHLDGRPQATEWKVVGSGFDRVDAFSRQPEGRLLERGACRRVHVDGEVVDSGDLRPAPQCGLGNGDCGLHGRAT